MYEIKNKTERKREKQREERIREREREMNNKKRLLNLPIVIESNEQGNREWDRVTFEWEKAIEVKPENNNIIVQYLDIVLFI